MAAESIFKSGKNFSHMFKWPIWKCQGQSTFCFGPCLDLSLCCQYPAISQTTIFRRLAAISELDWTVSEWDRVIIVLRVFNVSHV